MLRSPCVQRQLERKFEFHAVLAVVIFSRETEQSAENEDPYLFLVLLSIHGLPEHRHRLSWPAHNHRVNVAARQNQAWIRSSKFEEFL